MNSKHSLLVQPTNGELTDLEDTYSCVCLEIPEPTPTEVQDFASQQWHGESGLDVYIPDSIQSKAFDWDIKCGIKASNRGALNMYFSEMQGFMKRGKQLSVYSSFLDKGLASVVYKGVKDIENFVDASGISVITFTLCLWVIDPDTEVTPDDDDNPTELI